MGHDPKQACTLTASLIFSLNRQTGMGFTALVGRLGGSLAPLAALLDGVWLSLPKLAYGGVALLAACTALLLPETRRAQLPETIQDVESKRCVHRTTSVGVHACEDLSTLMGLGHICACAGMRASGYMA